MGPSASHSGLICFVNAREDVRTIIGPPVRVSDGGAPGLGIKHRPWDMFSRDGLTVHLEHPEGCERILMVKVMPGLRQG